MKSLKLLFDIIAITLLLIMPCTKSYSQVYELTSIEKLNTGDEIIIVNENSKVAMENVATSVNPKAISIESMLNEDKTEIHVTSNTNIQWIITKFNNATYSFNTPGTENFLRAINDYKGVFVGTKDSKTEDTYSWDETNSVLKATKTKGITDRYITYSGNINNDWRAYTSIVNLNPKTIFFKRTKNIANIKFETDNFTIKAGDNFNAPNLIYTEGLTGITYSISCTPMYSSDAPENMATLNETTGEITFRELLSLQHISREMILMVKQVLLILSIFLTLISYLQTIQRFLQQTNYMQMVNTSLFARSIKKHCQKYQAIMEMPLKSI